MACKCVAHGLCVASRQKNRRRCSFKCTFLRKAFYILNAFDLRVSLNAKRNVFWVISFFFGMRSAPRHIQRHSQLASAEQPPNKRQFDMMFA